MIESARYIRLWPIAFFLLATAISLPANPRAAGRALDRLDVRSGTQVQEIHIKFNFPVRYITHTPATSGDFLQIELRPVSIGETAGQEPNDRETLSWKPSEAVPLVDVSYVSDSPQSSALTLRFTRPVRYSVRSGSNFRSLVVTLPAPLVKQAPSARQDSTVSEEISRQANPAATSNAGDNLATPTAPKSKKEPVSVRQEAGDAGLAAPDEFDPSYRYAINLESSRRSLLGSTPPDLEAVRRYRLYTSRFVRGNTIWNRLRLGFFPTSEAAKEVRATLLEAYPDAWVTKVSRAERKRSVQRIFTDLVEGREGGAGRITGAAATPEKLAELMKEAAVAMTDGNVRRAIQLYTKVLRSPDHGHRQEAQELLGLARERNKQLAHAKAEYEDYLRFYPEGEGAERVRQRLAGLLTARAKPKGKLRKARGSEQEDDLVWGYAGSLSQFYNRDERFTDIEGRTIDRSELDSSLDFTGSVGDDRYEANLRFSGADLRDFSDSGRSGDSRLSALYVDVFDSQLEISGRVGRQSRSTGGVLGRHDGALVSYQALPKVKINGVAGFPVKTTTGLTFDKDRYFYGLSLDLGTFWENWDSNVFIVNQEVDGITDRRAVGGEVRYFAPNLTAFGLLDYDIFYNSLNIALFNGNYFFPDKTTVNLSLNYRNSPIITTTNALQGQGVDTVSQLLNTFSEGEVHQLAKDRTSVSRSVTLGASRPLNSTIQISADVTATDISDTEASGSVEAIPGTGVEFFYSAQLIGSGVIKEGDIAILGLRFSDTDRFRRYTVDINTRYPVNRVFRVSPRLRTDYRRNKGDDGTQVSVKPSVRFIYYWDRELQFELNAGGEWTNNRLDAESDDTLGLFVNLGYRFDF